MLDKINKNDYTYIHTYMYTNECTVLKIVRENRLNASARKRYEPLYVNITLQMQLQLPTGDTRVCIRQENHSIASARRAVSRTQRKGFSKSWAVRLYGRTVLTGSMRRSIAHSGRKPKTVISQGRDGNGRVQDGRLRQLSSRSWWARICSRQTLWQVTLETTVVGQQALPRCATVGRQLDRRRRRPNSIARLR